MRLALARGWLRAALSLGRVAELGVHAGSGGVGTVAIQLAKHLGATVATTVSASNAEFVRSLGADVVVDYRTEKFDEVLSGYDLVLDGVGPDNVLRSLRVVKPGGKVIGDFRATGYLPSYLQDFIVMGLVKKGEPFL